MRGTRETSPLPQAGGAGGGQERKFTSRNTKRAKELRHHTTPAEKHLWRFLRGSQLGVRFSRQMPVGPYFADFLSRSRKLIIELDGHSHDIAPEKDRERDSHLAKLGYQVIRFSNRDVMENAEGVVVAIKQALEQAHP